MNTIIIPAYEPSDELIVLTQALRKQCDARILVVDDGSGKAYGKCFSELDPTIRVIGYQQNQGKGFALKCAMNYIELLGWGPGSVVTADADGQHTAADILRVLNESETHPGALILGSRAFDTNVPRRSRFGNTVTRQVFSWVSGQRVSDTQTGLRAFSTEDIPLLMAVEGQRYEYEMNMLLDWAEQKRRIREVTIETVYHDASNSCSHFHTVSDSIRIYRQILRRSTSLLFALSSFMSFLLDYVLFLLLVRMFSASDAAWGVVVCNVLARIVSAVFNYNLNRVIVFRSRVSSKQTGLAYAALALGILIGNSAILSLLTNVFGLVPALAKIITELTLFITSYIVQKKLIFKSFYHAREKGNIS